MRRTIKVVSVLLAMLLLVTMATACKNSNEMNEVLSGESSINGSSGDTNSGDATNGNASNNESNNNANNASPDNPNSNNQQQQQVIESYDPTKKYDMDTNPLLTKTKKINTGIEPSFDIDTTGFVKNSIKVKDLKGKTLTLITAREGASFIYTGAKGEQLNEFTWYDSLKRTYGLNFKYIISRYTKAPQQIITYMNSGKTLDIIHTMRSGFPQYLMLSRPLNPYINTQYVGNSPGVDENTMEQMKWDNSYRAIGPVGAVDVIWYNETMAAEYGLQDPHTLWKQGKWTWEAWENFIVGVPTKTRDGKPLTPWAQSEGDAWTFWARTNGVNVFDIKTTDGKSKLISNFEDPRCLEAWVFYSGIVKGVDSVGRRESGHGDIQNNMYIRGTAIMTCTSHLMEDYREYPYAKTQKYNWVPYPAGPSGSNICMNYGFTYMIPKKVKNESNVPYSIKLAEIWANRFTEAIFDNFQMPYYDFDYIERKDYFEFTTKHGYFGVGTNIFEVLDGADREYYNRFIWSMYNQNYNAATQASELKNYVNKALSKMETYGK